MNNFKEKWMFELNSIFDCGFLNFILVSIANGFRCTSAVDLVTEREFVLKAKLYSLIREYT